MSQLISPAMVSTLPALFKLRAETTPLTTAYLHFDVATQTWQQTTWGEMLEAAGRWQFALSKEQLQPGDRVAVMARNCREWVLFEQAVLGLGLVLVPLYPQDRAESLAYILQHSEVKVLLIEGEEQWQCLQQILPAVVTLQKIVSLQNITNVADARLSSLTNWLGSEKSQFSTDNCQDGDKLATIVYTSGTTGRPKGVMLSHKNILWNAHGCYGCETIYSNDVFLSFLPLSHMLERTVGHYLPMMAGAAVAYARSIADLAEDMVAIKPTVIITVPRIFERMYNKISLQLAEKGYVAQRLFAMAVAVGWARFEYRQGRKGWRPSLLMWPLLAKLIATKILDKLGGRIRIAVCGGAPLGTTVAKTFVGLGLPLIQGYGMTEASPVATVNRCNNNEPASVGLPLPDVEVRIGEADELLVKSPGLMMGYWRDSAASAAAVTLEGWLRTGDKARVVNKRVYITGRIKEIIVLANGEKVSPADMEMAIATDPLFEQVMVAGEQRPYLSALVVVGSEQMAKMGISSPAIAKPGNNEFETYILQRISQLLHEFPGYAQIRRVAICNEKWTIDNGLITPTLKLRRGAILEKYKEEIAELYTGH